MTRPRALLRRLRPVMTAAVAAAAIAALAAAVVACSAALPGEALIERETPEGLARLESTLEARVRDDPEDIEALRRLALVRLRLGEVEAAERAALRAERLAPFDGAVLHTLGRVYLEGGRRFRALAAFGQALELAPDALEHYVSYARTQALLGDTEPALETLGAALRREPRYYPARYEQARLLFVQGRADAAEGAVEAALRIRPRAPEALLLQVRILEAQGRLSAAAVLAGRGREAHPEAREWPALLAGIHRQREDWEQAREALRRLAALGPLQPPETLLRAEVLAGLGREAEARRLLERLAREHPDFAPAAVALGRRELAADKPEAALAALTRAAELDPQSVAAQYWKAVAHYRLGETQQGDAALDTAERLEPDHRGVRLLRVARLLSRRRPGEARSRLDDHLAAHPGDPQALLLRSELHALTGAYDLALEALDGLAPGTLPARVRYARARVAYLRGNPRQVLGLTERGTEGGGEGDAGATPPALAWRLDTLRGAALARLGRHEAALAALTPHLGRRDGQGRIHRLVGYVRLRQGDEAGAEKVWRAGLGLFPGEPLLIEGLSRLAMRREDWPAARELLERGLGRESAFTLVFLERLEAVQRRLGDDAGAAATQRRYLEASDPLRAEVAAPVTPGILFGPGGAGLPPAAP